MPKMDFMKIWNRRDDILVGLDLGTRNTKIVVAEARPDGGLNLIGSSRVETMGIRKGEVHNHEDVVASIHEAVNETEKSVDGLVINQVEISLTGRHIGSFNNCGSVPIVSEDKEIAPADVEDAVSNAKHVALPQGHAAFHTIRQLFKVDERDGIPDPVGLLGSRLEVGVHIVHGQATSLENTILCVQAAEIEVGCRVFSGLASALSILAPQNKQQGAVVLDIGAGTTDYLVYAKGCIRGSGVIPVGGNHVTNDLSMGLKLPFFQAEKLKLEKVDLAASGRALEESFLWKTGEFQLVEKRFETRDVQAIARVRLEELFRIVQARLREQRLYDYLGSGVFITGGVSRTPGLRELAEAVFGLPVTIPSAQGVDGAHDPQLQPEFSTAIGLVKFAHQMRAEYSGRRPPGLLRTLLGK